MAMSPKDGQAGSARGSTKSRKTPASPPINEGKSKSSEARKVPSTGMGR
jgi:hypothetical protein